MILLSAWSKPLLSQQPNPKNYPWWPQVLEGIQLPVIQVAVTGDQQLVSNCLWNLSLTELDQLLEKCHTWLGVDSFFQHWAWHRQKKGIVIWGPSNPNIFGHDLNINLTLGPQAWRENQFHTWEQVPYNKNVFVNPDQVLAALETLIPGSTKKTIGKNIM
jgi:ADP-heptose:LPS heptosyltransferase